MKQFDQLIGGLCTLTGLPAQQHLMEGDAICYEGVNFAITANAEMHSDALLLYVDFGTLDLEKKAMLYPLMLKENFMMMGSRNGTFGVSATSDSVILMECMSLAATTPAMLLARMQLLARKAHYFNEQHRRLQRVAYQSGTARSATLRSPDPVRCAS